MPDKRRQTLLRPEARDDVDMIGEHRELVNMDAPECRCLSNNGADDLRVVPLDHSLSQSCVPGDVDVQTERSMRHP